VTPVPDPQPRPRLSPRELLERGAKVTGFDANPDMVDLAQPQTAGRVRIGQASPGKPLPYCRH
jgi:hypothetical protein